MNEEIRSSVARILLCFRVASINNKLRLSISQEYKGYKKVALVDNFQYFSSNLQTARAILIQE